MALRLVRQTSETPNVTNKDDTIMTRYAYGGYNGIVKALGNECGYTVDGGTFKVLDGRICLDGWEVEVGAEGVLLDLSSLAGFQYYSIYLEVNVLTETAEIKSPYLTGTYPEIEKGDDLTEVPNGTARLLLYNVKVENGIIKEVVKKFSLIEHTKTLIEQLDARLKQQGFSRASVENMGIVLTNNWTDAYPSHISGLLTYVDQKPSGEIVKSGLISWLRHLEFYSYRSSGVAEFSDSTFTLKVFESTPAKIPEKFLPKNNLEIKANLLHWVSSYVQVGGSYIQVDTQQSASITLTLSKDGSLSLPEKTIQYSRTEPPLWDSSHPIGIRIDEVSWFIKEPVEE